MEEVKTKLVDATELCASLVVSSHSSLAEWWYPNNDVYTTIKTPLKGHKDENGVGGVNTVGNGGEWCVSRIVVTPSRFWVESRIRDADA